MGLGSEYMFEAASKPLLAIARLSFSVGNS